MIPNEVPPGVKDGQQSRRVKATLPEMLRCLWRSSWKPNTRWWFQPL